MKKAFRSAIRLLSLLLCLALCLALLPQRSSAASTIVSVAAGLDSPTVGRSPDYTATLPDDAHCYSGNYNSGSYRNNIIWYDVTGGSYRALNPDTAVFEAGRTYLVEAILYPEDGWAFSSLQTTVTLNGRKADDFNIGSDGYLTFEYEFPPVAPLIDSVSLTVTPPAAGKAPLFHIACPSGAGYYNSDFTNAHLTNDIGWIDETGDSKVYLKPEDSFRYGRTYLFEVYLSAKDGYAFDRPGRVTATVNGEPAEVSEAGSQILVTYRFQPLTRTIDSVSIKIDPPAAGKAPGYTAEFPADAGYFSGSYSTSVYRNDIGWIDDESNAGLSPDGDVFQVGSRYKVAVYLTAKDGYSFDFNNVTATVNGKAATVRQAGSQILVTFVFDPVPKPIRTVHLYVNTPMPGNTPDYDSSVSSGSHCHLAKHNVEDSAGKTMIDGTSWGWLLDNGSIRIMNCDEEYESGRNYRVLMVLEPDKGYAFDFGNVTTYVNGREVKPVRDQNLLDVEYVFPTSSVHPKKITEVSLTVPVEAGATPSFEPVLPDGALYFNEPFNEGFSRNDVSWYSYADNESLTGDSRLKDGQKYRFRVYLTAKDGCIFDFDSVTATVNGSKATAEASWEQLCVSFDVTVGAGFMWGDVDGSGVVDTDDAMLILRYDVKKIGADKLKNFEAADVDGSGVVDSDDAMLILRYDVKKIKKFPVEQ